MSSSDEGDLFDPERVQLEKFPSLSNGIQEFRRIDWIMGLLWNKSQEKIIMNVPDTLVLTNYSSKSFSNDPSGVDESSGNLRWLFTASNGQVKKKASSSIGDKPIAKAANEWCEAASQHPKCDPVHDIAACMYYRDGSQRYLTIAELELLEFGAVETNAVALQKYVRPKGGVNSGVLVCRYKLDKNGMTFTSSTYRVSKQDATARPTIEKKPKGGIRLRASGLNRDIEQFAARVARHIFLMSGGLKVVYMQLQFIVGFDDRLWFTSAPLVGLRFQGLNAPSTQRSFVSKSTAVSQMSSLKANRKVEFRCTGDFCGYESEEERKLEKKIERLFLKEKKRQRQQKKKNRIKGEISHDKRETKEENDSADKPVIFHSVGFNIQRERLKQRQLLEKEIQKLKGEELSKTNNDERSVDVARSTLQEVNEVLNEDECVSNSESSSEDETYEDEDEDDMISENSDIYKPEVLKSQDNSIHKLSYRSVKMAREAEVAWMDDLLVHWLKRKNARKFLRRKLYIQIPFANQVLPQDGDIPFRVEWDWTGSIKRVCVQLARCSSDKVSNGEYSGTVSIVHTFEAGAPNTGKLNIHIPLVHPNWKYEHDLWCICISDASDSGLVKSYSGPFFLGGKHGEHPSGLGGKGKNYSIETLKAHRINPLIRSFDDDDTVNYDNNSALDTENRFLENHNPSHYYRDVKVCSCCYRIYKQLESCRLDSKPPLYKQEVSKQSISFHDSSMKRKKSKMTMVEQSKRVDIMSKPKRYASEGEFPGLTKWEAGFNLRGSSARQRKDKRISEELKKSSAKSLPDLSMKQNRSIYRAKNPETKIMKQVKRIASKKKQLVEDLSVDQYSQYVQQYQSLDETAQTKFEGLMSCFEDDPSTILESAEKLSKILRNEDGKVKSKKRRQKDSKAHQKQKEISPKKNDFSSRNAKEKECKNRNAKKKQKKKRKSSQIPLHSRVAANPDDMLDLKHPSIQPGTNLHQIICLLALGQLHDSKTMLEIVERRGLASLAYSKVENGKIILESENYRSPGSVKEKGKKVSFGERLNRTILGRQTLHLLSAFVSVCHIFVWALEENVKSTKIRAPLLFERAEKAETILQSFVNVHPISQARTHLMSGIKELIRAAGLVDKKHGSISEGDFRGSSVDHALEHWRKAVAVSARMAGLWSYDTGVAHYLMGKFSKEKDGRHLSAAAAIFSRLNEAYELKLVEKAQLAERDGVNKPSKKAIPRMSPEFVRTNRNKQTKADEPKKTRNDEATFSSKIKLLPSVEAGDENMEIQNVNFKASENTFNAGADSKEVNDESPLRNNSSKSTEKEKDFSSNSSLITTTLDWATRTLEATRRRLEDDFLLPHTLRTSSYAVLARSQMVQRALLVAEDLKKSFQSRTLAIKSENEANEVSEFEKKLMSSLDNLSVHVKALSALLSKIKEESDCDEDKADERSTNSVLFSDESETKSVISEITVHYDSQDDEYSDFEEGYEESVGSVGSGHEANLEALFEACNEQDEVKLRKILGDVSQKLGSSASEGLNKLVNSQGNTLLHNAAYSGWVNGVHICLSFGIDLDILNVEGNTALHLARRNEIIEDLLIAQGANKHVKNIYGLTYTEGLRPSMKITS